jgi:hypothetical protein
MYFVAIKTGRPFWQRALRVLLQAGSLCYFAPTGWKTLLLLSRAGVSAPGEGNQESDLKQERCALVWVSLEI